MRGFLFFVTFMHNITMNILQKIFSENLTELDKLNTRPAVMKNIYKMVNCGNPSFGGAMYHCRDCNFLKFVPFRCHSRFCPSCGTKYAMDRTEAMAFKLINTVHRHCVFTIDEKLRIFFRRDRNLLNLLFSAVRSVWYRYFFKIRKSEKYTPGFILVLHTFGRDLKWNPHIHCIISEGAMGKHRIWKSVKHFSYKFLRDAFQTTLLNLMEKKLGLSFKKVKALCYREHQNGFYVYAKPRKCNPKDVVKYIGRYLGRPVIATSRIDSYKNGLVTFHYNRHEDDKYVSETIPVMDFIKRLIVHIPDENFKMIRYYGLYASGNEYYHGLIPAISHEKRHYMMSLQYWRKRILLSFGYDVLCCPNCGTEMTLLDLYHNHQRIPFVENYHRLFGDKYY